MDFDLPDADNDKLRALEAGLNDLIRQDLPLRYTYVPLAEATSQHGLIRSRSVAPAARRRRAHPHRGDRRASTVRRAAGRIWPRPAGSRPLRILKIDNKGRHNRRVRIGLEG